MIKIRKAIPEDFDLILPLLEEFHNTSMTRGRWNRLFVNHWPVEEEHIGIVMLDDEKAVGFIGFLFSKRNINGEISKICNLSSWIVSKEYRSDIKSLSIITEMMKMKDYTISSFTSTPEAFTILMKFGFKLLEDQTAHLFPDKKQAEELSVITGDKNIKLVLSEDEFRIYQDHKDFNCSIFILAKNDSHCMIVTKKQKFTKRKFITSRSRNYIDLILRKTIKHSPLNEEIEFTSVHYFSNSEFFIKYQDSIAYYLTDLTNTFGLAVPKRFISGKNKIKVLFSNCTKAIYKSTELTAEQIDSIYSELFILDY